MNWSACGDLASQDHGAKWRFRGTSARCLIQTDGEHQRDRYWRETILDNAYKAWTKPLRALVHELLTHTSRETEQALGATVNIRVYIHTIFRRDAPRAAEAVRMPDALRHWTKGVLCFPHRETPLCGHTRNQGQKIFAVCPEDLQPGTRLNNLMVEFWRISLLVIIYFVVHFLQLRFSRKIKERS
jgi:hypothetical protein